jgi:protein-S-isoprenylcysteine O-methyltransferase Ste14
MSWSFWIILFAILVYGLVHSLLASLQAKALAREWFGPAANRWFRLLYNFVAVLTLLPILILPVILDDKPFYSIPLPWNIFTGMLQVAAVTFLAIGVYQTGLMSFLGIQQLFRPANEAPPKLVVNGLYRYVRHPLYTAGLAFIWLTPVMTLNLLAMNLGFTFYILVGALYEERKLLKEYGKIYAQYQQGTPMLIPRFQIKK